MPGRYIPDDDEDPNDVDPNDVDQDDDEDDKSEWTPPKTKAEFNAMVAKQGNPEAKKWRLRAQGRDPNWKPSGGPKDEDDKPDRKPKSDDDKLDADAIRAEARRELQAEYDQKADDGNKRAAVSVALMSAGLNLSDEVMQSPTKARKEVARVVSMLNLANITLEQDGELDGLDDEIQDLKKAYPGLFKDSGKSSGNGRPRTRGGDAGPKQDGKPSGNGIDADVRDLARAWFSS